MSAQYTGNVIGTQSNHVKIGIIGSSNVGKSTLFNSFVRNPDKFSSMESCLFTTLDPFIGVFQPEDFQLDFISSVKQPQSINASLLTIIDTAGLVEGSFREVHCVKMIIQYW